VPEPVVQLEEPSRGASKLSRLERPEPRGTAGFTLLEALVALAVAGAGLAAIGALANSSLRASFYTERDLAEIESARALARLSLECRVATRRQGLGVLEATALARVA